MADQATKPEATPLTLDQQGRIHPGNGRRFKEAIYTPNSSGGVHVSEKDEDGKVIKESQWTRNYTDWVGSEPLKDAPIAQIWGADRRNVIRWTTNYGTRVRIAFIDRAGLVELQKAFDALDEDEGQNSVEIHIQSITACKRGKNGYKYSDLMEVQFGADYFGEDHGEKRADFREKATQNATSEADNVKASLESIQPLTDEAYQALIDTAVEASMVAWDEKNPDPGTQTTDGE